MASETIKALLFDLDGTLLINEMERFMAHYWGAMGARFRSVCPLKLFRESLEAAMRAVWHNDGNGGTNAEVFAGEFFPRLGRQPEELMPLFDKFYALDFEALRQHTKPDPFARAVMKLAFERGYQVAIATQPMFPRVAILARLRWAGVSAEEFPYHFVASYETMSACKPHPHYFATLMEHLGRTPPECLMVGDSLQSDMPARTMGLKTFWVVRAPISKLAAMPCDAHGTLQDLATLIETGGIDEL